MKAIVLIIMKAGGKLNSYDKKRAVEDEDWVGTFE